MDDNFVRPPSAYIGDSPVPLLGNQRLTAGTSVQLDGSLVDVYVDTELIPSQVGAATARFFAPADDALGTSWAQPGFDDSSWAQGPMGLGFAPGEQFQDLLSTQVQPAAGGTTILARIPFTIGDPTQTMADPVVRLRYDDGVVLYLNGNEVLRRNVRDQTLSWNSRANARTNTAAVIFDDFNLGEFRHLLVPGQNLLAVRLINSSNTGNDMLLQAALVHRQTQVQRGQVGKIYYTLDGTDPRGTDGNPSATAVLWNAAQPLVITQNTRLIARNFDEEIDRGAEARIVRTDWSAPAHYELVVESPDLVIAEVNYHPADPTAEQVQAGLTAEEFEFIEIVNVGSTSASLVGVRLANGVEFDFYGGTVRSLEPGARTLVVANAQAFTARYGAGLSVAGEFTGDLNNQGERIELIDGTGALLSYLDYGDSDPWPVAADGSGATLIWDQSSTESVAARGKWYHWSSSAEPGGSPARDSRSRAGVVINEIIARGDDDENQRDAIELLNTTNQSIDISGWYLSDSNNDFFKYPLPAGTVLGPGQYVVFDERQFNPDPPVANITSFALSGDNGESVWLVIGNRQQGVTTFVDDVHFGAAGFGESFGRQSNATGRLAPMMRSSLGSVNGASRVGPLVISELEYHPVPSEAALAVDPQLDPSDLEFIEIHNPTAQRVDLTNWRLRGGVDYDFDSGLNLEPGGTLVVLRFNPADPENGRRLSALRAHYKINDSVRLVGGYAGELSNSDDRVRLLRPEIVETVPTPTTIHLWEDELLYDDLAPWPLDADGGGSSLERIAATAFGNDPRSWRAAAPTPGVAFGSRPGDFDDNGQVDLTDINLLLAQLASGAPATRFDLTGDGQVNANDRDAMVRDILRTSYGDANLDGIFDSRDFISVFQRGGYEDGIARNSLWDSGDWNGDGEFDSADLLFAAQFGSYDED
jgi:hypothetical protein